MDIRLEVRQYEQRDLDELHALVVHTVSTSYPAHYPPRAVQFFVEHHAPEKIVADGASAFVVVAFVDGRMVATGTLARGEIARVFVLPELQGHGIGKTIMDRIEDEARHLGLSRVVLDASLPAFGFYSARGYRKCSDEKLDVGENQELRYYRMAMELNTTW